MKKLLLGLTLLGSLSIMANESFERRGSHINKGCSMFSACGQAEVNATKKAKRDCQDHAKEKGLDPERCVKKDARKFSEGTASGEACFNPLAVHEASCSMTVEYIID